MPSLPTVAAPTPSAQVPEPPLSEAQVKTVNRAHTAESMRFMVHVRYTNERRSDFDGVCDPLYFHDVITAEGDFLIITLGPQKTLVVSSRNIMHVELSTNVSLT